MGKLGKIITGIIVVLLLSFPIITTCIISETEQSKYLQAEKVTLTKKSYGTLCAAKRMDVKEYFTVSGEYVSLSNYVLDISEISQDKNAFIFVKEGDLVNAGDRIGVCDDTDICSPVSGVISEIDITKGRECVLIDDYEDVALKIKCTNNSRYVKYMKNGTELKDSKENRYVVSKCYDVQNADGYYEVLISSCDGTFSHKSGACDLTLTNGMVYTGMLVLDKECIYRYDYSDAYYVRQVDELGNFIAELEVELGISTGRYIGVEGVEEGMLFDSGYKSIVEG